MLKSFFAYFGNSLLLAIFILLCVKFSLDQCSPVSGTRLFTMKVNVPDQLCSRIHSWEASRKHIHSQRSNESGPSAITTASYFEGSGFLEKIGLSDLVIVLNSDFRKRTTIQALSIVLLIISLIFMVIGKIIGDLYVLLFVQKEEIEKDYMAVYPPPKKTPGPNSTRTKATRELLPPPE